MELKKGMRVKFTGEGQPEVNVSGTGEILRVLSRGCEIILDAKTAANLPDIYSGKYVWRRHEHITPIVEEYRGFKVGERAWHPLLGIGTVVTEAEWRDDPANGKYEFSAGWVPFKPDSQSAINPGRSVWGEGNNLTRRVPLSEVKTRKEAEAWVGEEVELHGHRRDGKCPVGVITEWEEPWFRVRWTDRKGTDQNDGCYHPKSMRPLQEATEQQEKHAKAEKPKVTLNLKKSAFVDGVAVAKMALFGVTGGKCPHCRATRGEDHHADCPCRVFEPPAPQPDYASPGFAFIPVYTSRQDFIDSLSKGPWKKCSEVAPPKGKRGKYAREVEDGR